MIRRLSYLTLVVSVALVAGCNRSEPEPVAMIDPSAAAAAAEKAEAEIAKQAEQEKKSAKKTARHPASKAGGKNVYVVQLGAFKVKENAERMREQLKADGFPVIMKELNHSKNGMMYVVRIEPTPNRAEAEGMLSSIKEKKSIGGNILALPDAN